MWRFWRSGRPPYNSPADTLLSGDRAGGAVLGDSSHRGSRERKGQEYRIFCAISSGQRGPL